MNKKATAAIAGLESTFRTFQKTLAVAISEYVDNEVARRLHELAAGLKPAKRKPRTPAPPVTSKSPAATKPAGKSRKPRTTAPASSPPKVPGTVPGKVPGTVPGATKAKRGRKPKMAAEEVAGLADSALVLIAAADGDGIGKASIAASLGIETPQLRLPIAALIESGRITVTGAKRGTKYHAAA